MTAQASSHSNPVQWIAIGISIAAFCVALANLYLARRDRKRDLFLKMHQQMLDTDLRWGRGVLLNSVHVPEDVPRLRERTPDAFDAAGRSIAIMDVFALYARKGFIETELVLEEWGASLRRLDKAIALYTEHRTIEGGEPAWVHLTWLRGLAVAGASSANGQ